MLRKDKWLLFFLLNNTMQNCALVVVLATTTMKELNHLWKVFLQRKPTLCKLNILLLTIAL